MSDDRPNPLTDVRKGLGLLFRAARTTISRMPKSDVGRDLEEMVVTSAREVGRAIENVATTLEREVLGKRDRADEGKREGSDGEKGHDGGPPRGPNGGPPDAG
jgi:hypothetical protein